jgi:hypothetical protein
MILKTRFSHLEDYHDVPGNVYFMMTLEASNASVVIDIDDAINKFSNLSLSSFPGKNIKNFDGGWLCFAMQFWIGFAHQGVFYLM